MTAQTPAFSQQLWEWKCRNGSVKFPRTRTVKGNSKQGSGLGKLLVYAPIALELLSLMRRSRKKKGGKYIKARKRDRALDFLLGQAQRTVGGGKRGRR